MLRSFEQNGSLWTFAHESLLAASRHYAQSARPSGPNPRPDVDLVRSTPAWSLIEQLDAAVGRQAVRAMQPSKRWWGRPRRETRRKPQRRNPDGEEGVGAERVREEGKQQEGAQPEQLVMVQGAEEGQMEEEMKGWRPCP